MASIRELNLTTEGRWKEPHFSDPRWVLCTLEGWRYMSGGYERYGWMEFNVGWSVGGVTRDVFILGNMLGRTETWVR